MPSVKQCSPPLKKKCVKVLLESIVPIESAYEDGNGQEKKLTSLKERKNYRNMEVNSFFASLQL